MRQSLSFVLCLSDIVNFEAVPQYVLVSVVWVTPLLEKKLLIPIQLISEKAAFMNFPKRLHFVQVKIYKEMETNYLALSTAFEVVAFLQMTVFFILYGTSRFKD